MEEACATRGCGQRPRRVPSVARDGECGRLTPHPSPHTTVPRWGWTLFPGPDSPPGTPGVRGAGWHRGTREPCHSTDTQQGAGAAPQPLKEPKQARADVGGGWPACTCVHFRTCRVTPQGPGLLVTPQGASSPSLGARRRRTLRPAEMVSLLGGDKADWDGLQLGQEWGRGSLPLTGGSRAQGQHKGSGWVGG